MRSIDVRLVLHSAAETDDDAERATRQLRRTLAELDFPVSGFAPAGSLPEEAKSGTALAVGELVVALSASGGVLVTLISALRDWLGGRSASHRISVSINGDTLELEGATSAERERLIQAFISAHAKGE
jgi:hypothetical protein